MYRITAKKTNSESINEYTTIHHNYHDEVEKFRLELQFIINDPQNVFRTNLASDEDLDDATIVQGAVELLDALDKPKKKDPKYCTVIYRGLPCTMNVLSRKYYFGFSLGLMKNIYIDPNEPIKKERNFRSELTKAKHLIRRNCMNWITIMIDENTIIEKIL